MQRTIDVRSSTACAFAIAVVGSSACQPAVTADAGTDAPVAPACPIDGPVVEHGNTITADETWAAGRHLVTFDVSVRMGATLTIAPCATVRVRTRYGIDVLTGGTLVADGTALQPIRFEPETAGQPWRQIQVSQGQARLAYVTLEAGGEVANDPLSAALWLRGDNASSMAQPLVRVRHVTIRNATKYGVRLEANATFSADSADLTITGAGQFPVLSLPGSVGSVPSGLYTGNAVDEMLVLAGAIEWDMTLADRGVPYHIGRPGLADNSFRVMGMGTAVPLLTIEAGVTMRFERRAEIAIEHFTADVPAHGALHAIGTAARPVRFTSAAVNPAAGDWLGIWFGSIPDPRNRIEHAIIEYAGGTTGAENFGCRNPVSATTQNRAAVLILGLPSTAFITQTTISHSGGDAIERGWHGAATDFLATNTFEDIAWCQQSFPQPLTGACPDPAPCPR